MSLESVYARRHSIATLFVVVLLVAVFNIDSVACYDTFYAKYVVDYRHDARLFGHGNYRALEAILAMHDNVDVQYLSLAYPRLARAYRFDSLLGFRHFEKYQRLGFNVRQYSGSPRVFEQSRLNALQPTVDNRKRSRTNLPLADYFLNRNLQFESNESSSASPSSSSSSLTFQMFDSSRVRPGDLYELVYLAVHPHRNLATRTIAPVPTSFANLFFRIRALYESGGVSVDLDLLMRASVPSTARIFDARLNCAESERHFFTATQSRADSIFMAFPPRDPALKCVLDHYDNFSRQFVSSLEDDDSSDSKSILYCGTERMRAFDAKCTLSVVERCLDANVSRSGVQWLHCDQRWANALYTMPNNSYLVWKHVREGDRMLDAGGGDDGDDGEDEHLPAVWMGTYASDGRWEEPANDSFMARAFERAHRVVRRRLTADLSRTSLGELDATCLREWSRRQRDCAVFANATIQDVRRHAAHGHAHLHGIAEAVAYADEANRVTAWAQRQCSPMYLVPGARKAGSTFLFHALASHPQFLHPLRGSSYKEAHGYFAPESRNWLPQTVFPDGHWVGARLASFPCIERDEPFVTADGGVEHMRMPDVPPLALRDNRNMKAVLVLRDPTVRLRSDYWWTFVGNGTGRSSQVLLNEVRSYTQVVAKCARQLAAVAGVGVKKERPIVLDAVVNSNDDAIRVRTKTRTKTKRALDAAKMVDFFFRGDTACSGKYYGAGVGRMIRSGMYAPFVLHWSRTFGHDNVFLVTLRTLKAQPKAVCTRIWRALGLCAYELSDAALALHHNTNRQLASRTNENRTEQALLDAFLREAGEMYAPFNRILFDYLGVDFSWWA